VLMGADYWAPLLDFLRESMLVHGTIDRTDLDRIFVTDDVATAVAHVVAHAAPHVGDRLQKRARASALLGEQSLSKRA
jgi:predicted Rossmann-fold nucleotide-binding protein